MRGLDLRRVSLWARPWRAALSRTCRVRARALFESARVDVRPASALRRSDCAWWPIETQAHAGTCRSERQGAQLGLAAISGEVWPMHGRNILHRNVRAGPLHGRALIARRAAWIIGRNTPRGRAIVLRGRTAGAAGGDTHAARKHSPCAANSGSRAFLRDLGCALHRQLRQRSPKRQLFGQNCLRAFTTHRCAELGAQRRTRVRDCGLLNSPSRPRERDRDDPAGHETGSLAAVPRRASTRQKRKRYVAATLSGVCRHLTLHRNTGSHLRQGEAGHHAFEAALERVQLG